MYRALTGHAVPLTTQKSAFISVLTAAALGLACSSRKDGGQWTKPDKASLPDPVVMQIQDEGPRVEVGGCVTVLVDPTGSVECIYEPGQELRLWVVHDAGETPTIAAGVGDRWLPLRSDHYDHEEQLGRGYRPRLLGPDLDTLRVELPASARERVWQLALRSADRLSPRERNARAVLSRHTKALERRLKAGDQAAIMEYDRVVHEAIAQGMVGDAVNLALSASFRITWNIERPDITQWFLERLQPAADRFSEGRAGLAIYLAHALRRRGRLVEAATTYRRGSQLALAIDDEGLLFDGLAPYAHVLAQLGYFEAAAHWIAWVNRVAHDRAGPRDRALLLALVGDASLRLGEADRIHEDPDKLLREVLATHTAGANQAHLALAEHAMQSRDPAAALSWLRRVDRRRLTADSRVRAEDIRLRALLSSARGDDRRALNSSLAKLEILVRDAVGPHHRWRAALLRGRVHEALGEHREAASAYEDSEVLLDEMIPLAALGVPGDVTAARHGEGAERLVALQVQQGDFEAALCTARRSRARVARLVLQHQHFDEVDREQLLLRIERYADALVAYETVLDLDARHSATSKHERAKLEADRRREELSRDAFEILSSRGASWGRPRCEDLSARRPGELLLGLFPHGDDLHVFVSDQQGVTHRLLSNYFSAAVTADWLGDLLLDPMAPRLRRATRVRVLASGRAVAIPVHALTWLHRPATKHRVPMAMAMPVVYGLELPMLDQRSNSESGRDALVVTDARHPVAAADKHTLAYLLGRAGWRVDAIDSDERSAAQVRHAVASADHFHYEGHAYYAARGGELEAQNEQASDRFRRWPPYLGGAASEPSFIPLGEFGRLSVPDILMMTRVPRTVVLLGCRTGIMDERMAHGGFSLATAFLGAGSEAVVASTRQVEGEGAAILGRALYSKLQVDVGADPGQWMTDALHTIDRADLATVGIADYRVFVR